MRRPSRLEYAFAVGRVRALEKHLVSSAVFWEAAGETNFSSAIKVIFDNGRFPDAMVDITNSEELDAFLIQEEKALLIEMQDLIRERALLDLLTDKRKPDSSLALALNAGYPYISDYQRHKIDLGNLKIMLRLKYAGLPVEKFMSRMMEGGFLDDSILVRSFDLSYSEIGERLHASPYRELWDNAVEKLEELESFVALERAIEDFMMKYLKKAGHVVFGPEPVFAFGLAKRRELDFIRILGIGKMNRIPTDILKERLGETYV